MDKILNILANIEDVLPGPDSLHVMQDSSSNSKRQEVDRENCRRHYCRDKTPHKYLHCDITKAERIQRQVTKDGELKKLQHILSELLKNPAVKEIDQKMGENKHVSAYPTCSSGLQIQWMIDSGASSHFVTCRNAFIKERSDLTLSTRIADQPIMKSHISGDVELKVKGPSGLYSEIFLTDVFFNESLPFQILSLSRLCESYTVVTSGSEMKIYRKENLDNPITIASLKGDNLYYLDTEIQNSKLFVMSTDWHTRLGHRSFASVKKTVQECLKKDIKRDPKFKCAACSICKSKKLPFPSKAQHSADDILVRVHMDLAIDITPNPAFEGFRHFLVIVDE